MAVAVPPLERALAVAMAVAPPGLGELEGLPLAACSRVRVSPAVARWVPQNARSNNKRALRLDMSAIGLS